MDRVYCGGKPEGKYYFNVDCVWEIDDVREEEVDDGTELWSFEVVKVYSVSEFTKIVNEEVYVAEARAITTAFENAMELIE